MVLPIVLFMVVSTFFGSSDGFGYVPRIVGGLIANYGEFPYIVSLQVGEKHRCGGTIINNNTVLTAAHCLTDNLTVKAGIHNLKETSVRYKVKSVLSHPSYSSYYYDVALLKIEGFFTFGSKIRPIELEDTRVESDVPCISAGWGQVNASSETSSLLKYVELKTVSNEVCHAMYKPIDISIGMQHLCTLAKIYNGVCLGDSGGPLLNLDGKQIGIVSFVRPCAIGFPDVFSRISHYYAWIIDNI